MISVCCCIVERKRGLPVKTSNDLDLDAATADLAGSGRLDESSPFPQGLPLIKPERSRMRRASHTD